MDLDQVRKNLESRGFRARVFRTASEAADYLDSVIDGTAVSFGGSVTLQQMGLAERLEKHNEMPDYWNVPEGADADDVRKRSMYCEVYACSVNAMSENGEIVNIDGTGNRVAGTIFGHRRLYLVVGRNKIMPDLPSAIDRARNVASPLNAKRLNRHTPCVVDLRCHDCRSPERICRALSIHMAPTKSTDTEVLLIDEDLGL